MHAVLVPTINLECFKLVSRSRVVTKWIGVLYDYLLLKSTETSFLKLFADIGMQKRTETLGDLSRKFSHS